MFSLLPFRRRAPKLSSYLPWAGLVAPGIVLNKDGAFQRTLKFRGPDLDAATPAELAGVSARINNILRRFGSGWCLHVEARRDPSPGYPESQFDCALAWLIDEERREVAGRAGARFESAYFLTLTFLPPPERQARLENLLFEGGGRRGGISYDAWLARFTEETGHALTLLQPLMPEAAWLPDAETLGYLHDCVSDRRLGVLAVPPEPFHLDGLLTDAPLTGGLSPRLGAKHLRIISVRSFVSSTEPGLLDVLNRVPVACRWVTRFLPLGPEEARREIERIRKRWFSKRKGLGALLRDALFREESVLSDNDAVAQAEDADAALQALGSGTVSAGYATLVIVIAEDTEAAADEAAGLVRQAADGLGLVTEIEGINAVEAWLGSLPGQAYADVRRPVILTHSLVHLLPMSAVWAGAPENTHLKAPPLMVAASDGATPFRLNLHDGDTGHTLVTGPTGSGKSVLLAMLIAQWLRYDGAQAYVFDRGRSLRAMVLGLGGTVHDLGEEETQGFQPLADIDTGPGRAWAQDWLCDLMTASGLTLNPARRAALWQTLDLLAGRSPPERTLSLLSALVQDDAVRAALAPFTHEGPLGRLLDADAAGALPGAVEAFEMDDLLERPQAAGAVLPVIFRRLEARFTGRPTLLVLDEAWLYLGDTRFAARIRDWLKTLRKLNVAVVFASQELADVAQSSIAATITEATATRIFLPNDRAREPATRSFYEAAGLNARQTDLIASAIPKQDYYVVTRAGSRMIDLGIGPAALAFAGAGRPEDQRLIDRLLEAGGAADFARLWLAARGLPEAAAAIARFEAAAGTGTDEAPQKPARPLAPTSLTPYTEFAA